MTPPRGWRIVAAVAAVIAAMVLAILAVAGTDEAGIRVVIRATARTSVVLFCAAFVASSAARAWPGPTTRWLLANRRYVGVSFAVSHFVHLLAILALAGWSVSRMAADAGATTGILGGVAYVFVAAMTATSFDRTAAWLGPRRWKQLHTIGAYYIWFVFFASFVPRAFTSLVHVPFALLVIAALAVRLRHRVRAPVAAAVSA